MGTALRVQEERDQGNVKNGAEERNTNEGPIHNQVLDKRCERGSDGNFVANFALVGH
jgi:hypothetical protein